MWRIKPPMVFSNSFANSLKSMYSILCRLKLVLVVMVLSGCGGVPLYSDLNEQQANEMQAVLMTAGINAEKKASPDGKTWQLMVPGEHIPDAMSLLNEQGLPQTAAPTIADVFRKEGFVSSPVEEHARYVYALSQELANTIMQLDGVASARVHVALPKRALLDDEQQSASVSVVVIQKPGFDLSRYETDIKAIVTDGIEGLDDINRVTVKFFQREAKAPVTIVQSSMDERLYYGGLVAATLVLLGGGFGMGQWWRYRRRPSIKPKIELPGRV